MLVFIVWPGFAGSSMPVIISAVVEMGERSRVARRAAVRGFCVASMVVVPVFGFECAITVLLLPV